MEVETAGGGHRPRRGVAALVSVVALIALVSCSAAKGADGRATLSESTNGTDLKMLVISADGTEQDFLAVTSALDQTGVPFESFIVSKTPMTGAEFATFLSDRPSHAKFSAIVLSTGNLISATPQPNNTQARLSDDERAALVAYEAKFHIRSVTANTYPDPTFGLKYVGYHAPSTVPLGAVLTDAGKKVFPYLNPSNPMPITNAGVYFASLADPATTTPLMNVTGPDGQLHPVVSVTKYPDGRENLAITAANNPQLVHTILLSYGWISWVTKGIFVGARSPSLNIQVDDLFLTDQLWDPQLHADGTAKFRNDGADIQALANWENHRHTFPSTPNVKINFAFVGSGTNPGRYPGDTLLPAVQANKAEFGFINHTFSHYDLDCGATATCAGAFKATAADIEREIDENITRGRELGLTSDWDTMVQPDVSGVNKTPGSDAVAAAAHAGIRYWISDTSRPGQANPAFNVGIRPQGDDGRIYVVPRHPTNLFFDDSTPAQWVDEYNHTYAPGGTLCAQTTCFDAPQTYEQILDHESDVMLRYLLTGDDDPIMFHTPNTRAYDGKHSLLTDLLDSTLAKYDALMTTPIAAPTFKDVGLAQKAREAFDAAGLTATLLPGNRLSLHVDHAATIPLTGVRSGSRQETLDGTVVSSVELRAGQTLVIPGVSGT